MGPNFEERCRNDAKGKKGLLPKSAQKSGRHPLSAVHDKEFFNEQDRQNRNDHADNKGSCHLNVLECPLVKKYQESLKKGRERFSGHRVERSPSRKAGSVGKSFAKEKRKSDPEKSQSDRDSRSTCSNALENVRSTRAQELRTKSNLDSLSSKSTDISSPYASSFFQKKKPNSAESKCFPRRSVPEKNVIEKEKGGKNVERSGKSEKFFERAGSDPSTTTDSGDFRRIGLKKSTTFFICKGPKLERGDNGNVSSSSRIVESEEETFSPRPNPITHNDSFCLIAKSSRKWCRKNRSDDEKLLRYGFETEPTKSGKKEEKGILKNNSRDLKSVDSLERIDSEKIVRFSDEQSGKGKVLKKNVHRKRRLQNTVNAAWYRRNKLFQKYLQILKSKSILYGPQEASPRGNKPYPDSSFMKDRYEAEMLGLVPRQGRFLKNKKKFLIEDDDLE